MSAPGDTGILLEDANGLVQHCTPSLLRHVGVPESADHYRGRPASALHEMLASAFLDRAAYLDGVEFLRARGQAVHREVLGILRDLKDHKTTPSAEKAWFNAAA